MRGLASGGAGAERRAPHVPLTSNFEGVSDGASKDRERVEGRLPVGQWHSHPRTTAISASAGAHGDDATAGGRGWPYRDPNDGRQQRSQYRKDDQDRQ